MFSGLFWADYQCENDINTLDDCVDSKNCPIANVDSIEECKIFCSMDAYCNTLVYNKYKECYLKGASETQVADDSEHETISCQKNGNGHFYFGALGFMFLRRDLIQCYTGIFSYLLCNNFFLSKIITIGVGWRCIE